MTALLTGMIYRMAPLRWARPPPVFQGGRFTFTEPVMSARVEVVKLALRRVDVDTIAHAREWHLSARGGAKHSHRRRCKALSPPRGHRATRAAAHHREVAGALDHQAGEESSQARYGQAALRSVRCQGWAGLSARTAPQAVTLVVTRGP